jgi:hypothetical protein
VVRKKNYIRSGVRQTQKKLPNATYAVQLLIVIIQKTLDGVRLDKVGVGFFGKKVQMDMTFMQKS